MKRVIHWVMTGVSFLSIPFFWLFEALADATTLKETFLNWNEYRRSGRPWGWIDK